MRNANICGRFRCMKKVEKHWSTMHIELTFLWWAFPMHFAHSKSEDAQTANCLLDLLFLVTVATLGSLQRLLRTRQPHEDQGLCHRCSRRQLRWLRRQRVWDRVVRSQGECFHGLRDLSVMKKCCWKINMNWPASSLFTRYCYFAFNVIFH